MQELEKILEEMKESSIMVATSKEHYIHPQDGRFVEEVVLLNDVEEIIRKHMSGKGKDAHMNDGWIPVEKDLPKNESEVWVVLESTYGTGFRIYSSARYLYFENYGEGHWCDEHYGYLEWDKYSDGRGGSSQYKVIAWRSIAPYRPERSNDEKE